MKKITTHIILYCLLTFCKQSVSQKLYKGELQLINFMLKDCNAVDSEDSFRIISTILDVNRQFGVTKIRFVTNGTSTSHFVPHLFGGGTMHINVGGTSSVYEKWLGELPHAEQFNQRRFYYVGKSLLGFVSTFFNSMNLSESEELEVKKLIDINKCKKWKAKLWVAYKRQYHKKSSFEGVAHSKMEPIIRYRISLLFVPH